MSTKNKLPLFDYGHPLTAVGCGNMADMNGVTLQMKRDIRLIGRFAEVWCAGHRHDARGAFLLPAVGGTVQLCAECAAFMEYAAGRRLICPLEEEKPSCKHCRIHCYSAEHRAMARKIMAWSGRRMIMRGRIDYIWHYFF